MSDEFIPNHPTIAVIGLGYVGLPLALEFASQFQVIGFDTNSARVDAMKQGLDPSHQMDSAAFLNKTIEFTSQTEDLRQATFFVIAVPTPVDEYKVPDLTSLLKASETVGRVLKKGDVVVFESTVYPGCTEDDCLPILERVSGLSLGIDFKIGYSPERINPGDKVHTLATILKIVSGSDNAALEQIAEIYGKIITAGIYKASSIKVAEAAKVIENTQRDLNISLMNELAIIFDRLGIDTQEVIEAAGTKWNFLKFYPGLVGGHCIGVDPYYLLHKSRQLGYDPQVIHSGRRINDGMPAFIASKLVQMLIQKGKSPQHARVLMMGITFKENISDIRNSKVADLVRELMQFAVHVHLVDACASPNEVAREYNLTLLDEPSGNYDAVVVAVAHDEYKSLTISYFKSITQPDAILMDLKGLYKNQSDQQLTYWRL
ncbi:nucleotide sugar dehydrogenase [Arundinibacter roseus]|uniref:Nucleotide sugar dehydrogenase n=1 Tax=Arundinibacter roseus TaxID=2070510 RepID=A0A4R4KA82_9BACT|nr:nucleotide sugar dehydrogenase [Arundinibacter roseus]TDB63456.1 nucleotide sugar dehydrogenase [Arundinibacter roseus]